MILFNGNCPKCQGECEPTNYEWIGDAVAVTFECTECRHDFSVIFSNGLMVE